MKNALLLFCTIISIASVSKYNTFEPPVVAMATVNLTNVKQNILFMGGDMERSANAVQDAANKTQIIQWGFGDIPFNICRMQYDKNQEMTEGVKNFGFYNKMLATMRAIKTVNPQIKFMATMRSDYNGFNQGDTNNLPVWIYSRITEKLNVTKYATFLADYVEYMSDQGLPIDYLSTAKEWTSVIPADSATKVITQLNTALTARGVAKPLIIDPASWSISQGITYANRVRQLGKTGQVFAFCTHNYNDSETKTYTDYNNAVKLTGKPGFHDETSAGGSGRFTPAGINPPITSVLSAYSEKFDIYEAGLAGEIFFELWSRGVNAESRSIYFPTNGTGVRRRSYYIMKDFATGALDAQFIPVSFNTTSNLRSIAFKQDNTLTVWVLNESTTAVNDFNFEVTNGSIGGNVPTTTWTETGADIGVTTTVTNAHLDNTIRKAISPQSITVFKVVLNRIVPIELKDFTAKCEKSQNALKWTTASESNNALFTLEKSENGKEWAILATQKGAGNSSQIQNYSFMDDKPFEQFTYYRLKQTDVNGAFSYSKTLSVSSCTEGGQKLRIYPQPANHTLTVDNIPEQATLILRDYAGKVVLKKPTNGQTKMLLDVATIVNGIYFLQVVSEKLNVSEKIVIAR